MHACVYVWMPTLVSQPPHSLPALEEARDISMHLRPLRSHCEEMEESEYLELSQKFPPFFHCVGLVWAHSEHYQTPSRLVVFLQEVSNLLIELVGSQVTAYWMLTGVGNWWVHRSLYWMLAVVGNWWVHRSLHIGCWQYIGNWWVHRSLHIGCWQ